MFIDCPKCKLKFQVVDKSLREGAKLRCFNCGKIWVPNSPVLSEGALNKVPNLSDVQSKKERPTAEKNNSSNMSISQCVFCGSANSCKGPLMNRLSGRFHH